MTILLIGPSGSGKDTQSDMLVEKYNFEMISTGQLLRDEVKTNSDLGKEVESFLSQGKFVPDEIVMDVLGKHIDKFKSDRILLNGAVRSYEQVFLLDEILNENVLMIDAVLYFDLDDKTALERLLGRGREDDTYEKILSRLAEFKKSNEKIISEYEERGVLVRLDASKSINDIHEEIVDKLNIDKVSKNEENNS